LERVFEALKAKGDKATVFQWRKLREACLISKRKCNEILIKGIGDIVAHVRYFISLVYEEAVKFNLRKCEMAECHIAISKLLDFYMETGKFNNSFLSIIILFRFHYTRNVNEGLAEVSKILRQKIPLDLVKDSNVKLALKVCKLAADGNYWIIKKIKSSDMAYDPDFLLLIDLIGESCRKTFVWNIIKAYPIVSISWIRILLHTDDSIYTLKSLLESSGDGRSIELNENGDKFILKKKK